MSGLPQVPTAADWASLSVESTLAATLVVVLIAPFFSRSKWTLGGIALAGLLAAFGTTFVPHAGTPTFFGMLIADPAATFWRQVLLLFSSGIVVLWLSATDSSSSRSHAPEFLTLLVSATLGLSLMGATSNLLLIVLGTELASMPSYILAGFRKNRRHAAEAALKYVLFGGVCTATMIYGLSLLYGSAGTLDVGTWLSASRGAFSPTATLGALFLLLGLLFKISAVPAHFWCPDVFEGAHVDVAAFLSVASKGAGLILLARLWDAAAQHQTSSVSAMAAVLATIAVVTTTVGNLGALRQQSVKRILAYSSIAHAGYMLSTLAILPSGRVSLLIYLVVYALMNLGAFAVLSGVEKRSNSDQLTAFDGLIHRSPLAAVAMAVCLVSMVGLPPAAGILAKYKIMAVLGQAGGAWWIVLASVAINSIVSLVYYAKILQAMFLRRSDQADALPVGVTALSAVCALTLVLMLVGFAPLERWAEQATFWLPPVQTP